MSSYSEQLKNPLWQKKRLEIFNRDNFTCQICLDTEETLQVHHKFYDKGKKAWEYGNDRLTTLCETCHKELELHIKQWKHSNEFDVIKFKQEFSKPIVVIYSYGFIKFIFPTNDHTLTERQSVKLVQFLINNQLKNG